MFDPCCRQLVLAWLAVVQDYAVLGSYGPVVHAAYTPRLLQPLDLLPTPSIITSLEPHLQACWPAALRALAAILPQAPGGMLPMSMSFIWHAVLCALLQLCRCHASAASILQRLCARRTGTCLQLQLNTQISLC